MYFTQNKLMRKNIAIVCGGDSSEAEVSLKSGRNLKVMMDGGAYNTFIVFMKASYWAVQVDGCPDSIIDKSDFSFVHDGVKTTFDCAYITIHGTPGENGILQAYFELVSIPYTSCGVFTSALTFNKFACKAFASQYGVDTAKAILVRKGDSVDARDVLERLGSPCFVKPNNAGSSFGVSKVKDASDLNPALEKAFAEDDEVIIEEFLSGTEITNGVYRTGGSINVLPITEIVSENEFFDYEAKYTGKSKEITPARLTTEVECKVKSTTEMLYKALGCDGIVRIDYILSQNRITMLEVNTTPGMSPASIIPQQITSMKLEHKQVFESIVEDSIKRFKTKALNIK